MAAYTPNVPWARFGCPDVVDLDGAGTSAATPQIAAAAALWMQKNRAACAAYTEPWMRVEAVRQALFDSASADIAAPGHFGAAAAREGALGRAAAAGALRRQAAGRRGLSRCSSFYRAGPGAAAPAKRRMLELEALQLSQATGLETHPARCRRVDPRSPGAARR